jgi:hypothetical protein
MRLTRPILALFTCLALLISLAPGGAAPLAQADPCCAGEPSGSDDHPNGCDSATCIGGCCRITSIKAEAVGALDRCIEAALDTTAVAPARRCSLIDPEAIFHPPRA